MKLNTVKLNDSVPLNTVSLNDSVTSDRSGAPDQSERVRLLLAELSPSSRVREVMETDSGHDPAVWARLAYDGILGLAIPTRWGGLGRSWIELAAVLAEVGAALACIPFLSTVAIAATAIARSADDAIRDELLPAIAAGNLIATVAVAEDTGDWNPSHGSTTATPDGNQWRLEGNKSYVLDAMVADVILVTARTDEGPAVFVVSGDANGLTRAPLVTVDQTRRQGRLVLDATPARLLLGGSASGLSDLGALSVAAESVGGTRRCLELAVAHAQNRVQFGQPIGSFQAVSHKCAEMLVDLECARAAVGHGAADLTADTDLTALATSAPVAKVAATEAFARAAAATIQIHGGVGFTWDCDAQLYFKRARSAQLAFGDARYHRELLAQRLSW